jgi:Skp1 family, tetramerisation domain
MTRVRTNDGQVMEVDPNFVQQCSTLKMVTEMLDCSDEYASFDEVPLPNVDAALMETVVRFFSSGSIPEFQEPREVFPLYDAADYLGYEALQDAVAKGVAESLKGRDPDEIRAIFDLEVPGKSIE